MPGGIIPGGGIGRGPLAACGGGGGGGGIMGGIIGCGGGWS
jgi:hypothetical protein